MKQKLGFTFGESIISIKQKRLRIKGGKNIDFHNRLGFFWVLLIIAFIIIFVQLVKLTIFQGKYYRDLASYNRIKENIYPAPRGVITDRKREIIARNKPGFVGEVPCGNSKCFRKLSHEEALKLEAESRVSILQLGITRDYPDDWTFSHLLGTVSSVYKEEVGSNYCGRKLTFTDELGRSGVEKTFDCLLSGTYGKELVETDATGKAVKVLSKIESKPGKTLTLSIDKNLQLKARELLEDKKGAVIIHNPQTGEILTLYSSPSYNLNQFIEGLSEEEYQKLIKDNNKPLFNRAISGVYPPGSLIKPLIAAGALEDKIITKDTEIEDVGVIKIGEFSFANWYFTKYGKTEGPVNVVRAIKRSNDVYFYKIGEMMGVDKIAVWAKKFKLGQKLGIGIPGEEEGTVPDKLWKEKEKAEKWFLGDTYHVAIGQGDLLVTPLQIGFALGSFGNNGIICKPSIVKKDNCTKLTDKLISTQTLNIVKEGMVEACATGGTAYPFFDYKVGERSIKIACKTGTAEFGDPKDATHAWFFAFAPIDNPQIAITVLVEGGGEGSSVAAPIAKSIMDEWFKN